VVTSTLSDVYSAVTAAIGALKGPLAGPAYYLMGFDIPMFTPIFVLSRITGWTAHSIEQSAANALIRPLSLYAGEAQRHVPGPRLAGAA
jgi:citrate synthase